MSRDRSSLSEGAAADERWDQSFGDAVRDAYPDAEPSDELRARIRLRLSQQAATGRSRIWHPALRFSLAAAALLVLLLFLILAPPRSVDAGLLDRIVEAMARVRTGHLVFMRITDDGRMVYERQLWYREGLWRTEDERFNAIHTPEGVWVQRRPSGRWIRSKEKSRLGNDLSELAPAVLGRKFQEWGRGAQVRHLENWGGPPGSVTVAVELHDEPERLVLTVDRVTNLLISVEFQSRRNGKWQSTTRVKVELGKPVSAGLFRPVESG
ncbi:MAG: hypothetical protein ACK47B_29245 [Armatimonadota bacterium]